MDQTKFTTNYNRIREHTYVTINAALKEMIAMNKNFTNKKENKLYDNKSNYRIKEP